MLTVIGTGPTPLGQPINVLVGGLNLIAYGVDLNIPLAFGDYDVTFALPTDVAYGPRAAWIYANYGATVGAGLAVQLALWDLTHDGGDGFDAGAVQLNPTFPAPIRGLAVSILTASIGQSSTEARIAYLTGIPSGLPGQTLILAPESLTFSVADVPEPGTGLCLAAALLLGAARERFRSQSPRSH